MFDVLVLGSGVAGLSAAVHAAAAGRRVVVLTKGKLHHSTTRYAQGGVAAALAPSDSPELHLSDTLAAGAGLCDADAVRVMVTEGPRRVRELAALGAEFDRAGGAPGLALAREGGHSLARVVHAGGDATGAEIERALVAAVRATAAGVREGWFTSDLLVEGGRCVGVRAVGPDGGAADVRAAHTILATGGVGQLYAVTTNPRLATGDGIAMAVRAGVLAADLEFVQFHPTALAQATMPRPLISEALRGEGALLRDEQGVAFMAWEHPLGDLAPRDVVSRAIATRLAERGLDHLWLDATSIDGFEQRFPTIFRACTAAGLDPRRDWLPVAPAAHYLSGGVLTDLWGATSLPGLWACGEVACSGVHGANRLASNSLLDGLVFGPRAVEAVLDGRDGPEESGAMRGARAALAGPAAAPVDVAPPAEAAPPLPAGRGEPATVAEAVDRLQRAMTEGAGVLRDATSLAGAAAAVAAARAASHHLPAGRPRDELVNLCVVAAGLVAAATARTESRGSHTRLDAPEPSPAFAGRFVVGDGRVAFAPLPAGSREPAR